MAHAVRAVTGRQAGETGPVAGGELRKKKQSRPPTSKKGGVVMMKNKNSHGLTTLLSPVALRMELLGAVALVLVAGRILPGFGKLLRQFYMLLFP